MDTTNMIHKNDIDGFKRFLTKDCNLSQSTIDSYVTSIAHFFKKNEELTKENFKNYLDDRMKSGLSPKSANLKINAYNKLMKYSGTENQQLKTSKIERRLSLENIPTEYHYGKLLEFLSRKENKDYYYWIRIMACTGARISEFIQFTWEDIIRGIFTLRGKGNKYRNFYIPKKISSEILIYANKYNKQGFFVKNRFGEKMSARGVSQLLVAWGYELNFKKGMLRPHAFRHFFAKQYLKNSKKDIVQLAEFLGHSSLDTTRVYLLKSIEEQRHDFNKYVTW